MRTATATIVLAGAALLLALTPPTTSAWRATPGGWVSGPVEYVKTVHQEAGGAVDGVLHDDFLYVSSWRSFSIYDVSDPLAPERKSTWPLVVGVYNERPQTNGEILLLSRDAQYLPPTEEVRGGRHLDIYDVSDPSNPEFITTYDAEQTEMFDTRYDHIWTCIRDCAYAYGSGGTILDLRDPADPTMVGDWTEQAPFEPESDHFIGTVADGIVVTGSLPSHVLDTREDPTAPTLLATFDPRSNALDAPLSNPYTKVARADWPGALTGPLAILTTESPFKGSCDDTVGDVQTYRTSGWEGTGTFQPLDSYQITENGTYTDGAPPANALGCSAYGLDVHAGFGPTGGSAAVSFFEHGIRVLDVTADGAISERGGFLPLAGDSSTPLWRNDEVLYVMDIDRGVDILRVDPATG